MRDFRLPPLCKWKLRSYEMLRSANWYLDTDVSVKPNGPIFKVQAVCLAVENGNYRLSQKSVTKYKLTLRNISEERRSRVCYSSQ
jgi:hypothetical protein